MANATSTPQIGRPCTHPWEYAVEPFHIIDRIYYVGNRDVSSHLIRTDDGLILLDTAFPQTVYLLLESIRKLGFSPAEIKYILHSHAHYDHLGGTKALVELTGAKAFLGEQDIFFLTDRPELTWAPEYGCQFHEAFKVDHPLHDGDVVSLGGVSIRCVNIPGHTPGSISWFLDAKEAGRTYRVGFHGGPGINTLTDEFLARRNWPASWRDVYWQSWEKLKREQVDIFLGVHPSQSDTLGRQARRTRAVAGVRPGAGAAGSGHPPAANPFIDSAAWPAFLKKLGEDAKQVFDDSAKGIGT